MLEHLDPFQRSVEQWLTSQLPEDGHTVLFGSGGRQRRIAAAAARVRGCDVVYVSVPPDADRIPYVLLSMAEQCGVSERVSLLLREGEISQAAEALTAEMESKFLVVAGWDLLRGEDDGGLSEAFEVERDQFRAWLDRRRRPFLPAVRPIDLAVQAPANEVVAVLWELSGYDLDRFRLLVIAHAMFGHPATGMDPQDTQALVSTICAALPTDVRTLLQALAVHGRPIRRQVLSELGLGTIQTLAKASRALLLEEVADQVSVDPSFLRLFIEHLSLSLNKTSEEHRSLAERFATHAAGHNAPGSHLEAHRHFAAAGDLRRAADFAQYSVAMLLDGARRASMAARPGLPDLERQALREFAVEGYDAVLQLASRTRVVPPRARAYAMHYRAYNRYKLELDSIADTAAGYRDSLAGWAENAWFWSRLVRAYAVQGDLAAAEQAQRQAYEIVSEHPRRDELLRTKVVESLSERGLWLRALALGESPLEGASGTRVLDRLNRGAMIGSIEAVGGLQVRLLVETPFLLFERSGTFHAVVPGLESSATSARGAVARLARAIRPATAGTCVDLFMSVAPIFEGLMARVRHAWGHRAKQERTDLVGEWRQKGAAGLSWLVWRVSDDADSDELHGAFDLLCAAKADAIPFVLAALERSVKHLEGLATLVRVLAYLPIGNSERVDVIVQRLQDHENEDVRDACAELADVRSRSAA